MSLLRLVYNMQAVDLLILMLATYLLTDALVNRVLPWNIMGRIRDRLQWQIFQCMYCSVWYAGVAVYLLWLVEPQLVYPFAAGGGAIILWRYTGANAI